MKAARRPNIIRQAACDFAASIARFAAYVSPEIVVLAILAAVLLLGGAV